MAASARVKINFDNVAIRKLHREPGVIEYRHKVAEVIGDNWRAIAPVYTGALITEEHQRKFPPGTYKRSVKVEGTTVGNTVFYAHMVEWGTERMRPQGVGRRAVKTLGMKLREESRDLPE